jgi:hypothetical protein
VTDSRLRQALAAGAAVLAVALTTAPVRAQWPTVLMFYGGPLKAPVFVTGEDSVAIAPAFRPYAGGGIPAKSAASMEDRPFINVACFWGTAADPAANGTRNLADLTPAMAWQHARFYPASRGNPAVVFVTGLEKKVARGPAMPVPAASEQYFLNGPLSTDALTVLRRLGIPTSQP